MRRAPRIGDRLLHGTRRLYHRAARTGRHRRSAGAAQPLGVRDQRRARRRAGHAACEGRCRAGAGVRMDPDQIGDGQPRRAAHLRQRRPAGPLRRRGDDVRAILREHDCRRRRTFRLRVGARTAETDRRFRSDALQLGHRRRALPRPAAVRSVQRSRRLRAHRRHRDHTAGAPGPGHIRRHRQHRVRCGERHRDRGPEHRLDRGDQGEFGRLLRLCEEHCETAPCVGASRGPGPDTTPPELVDPGATPEDPEP